MKLKEILLKILAYKKIIMIVLIAISLAIIVTATYVTTYNANEVTREEVLTNTPTGEYRSNEEFYANFDTFEITIDDNKGLVKPYTDSNGNLVSGYFKFKVTSSLAEDSKIKNSVKVTGGLGANWINYISKTGSTSFTPGSTSATFKIDGIDKTFPASGSLLFVTVDYPTLYVLVEWQELSSYYYTYLQFTPDQYM